jgi:hypothetical protein
MKMKILGITFAVALVTALLLACAPKTSPVLYDYNTPAEAIPGGFGGGGNGSDYLSQSFVCTKTNMTDEIAVKLSRLSGDTGNITATLYAENAYPTTKLATASIPASSISTTAATSLTGNYTLTMSQPVTELAGNSYAIVLASPDADVIDWYYGSAPLTNGLMQTYYQPMWYTLTGLGAFWFEDLGK